MVTARLLTGPLPLLPVLPPPPVLPVAPLAVLPVVMTCPASTLPSNGMSPSWI